MMKKTNFERYLENLNKELKNPIKESFVQKSENISEEENCDISELMDEVEQMKKEIDSIFVSQSFLNEMHDSSLHAEDEEEFNPKTWEKGNTKINEAMKVYNEQKKQSYKGEQEKESFNRLINYSIPLDKQRVNESAMWGRSKQMDRLVVLMDTQEAILITKENFDFDKLDGKFAMNASKAGHALNVFDQLFETWYEYDKKEFEKLL
jgi:hypothetical protein